MCHNSWGDKHFYSTIPRLEDALRPKMRRHRNPDGSRGGLVAETAEVEKTVYVGPNACVDGTAQVSGKVKLLGHAYVCHQAKVSGNVMVSQNASVEGNSKVEGNARISGRAVVSHYARVSGKVRISGHVMIEGASEVRGEGSLTGHLIIDSRDANLPWGPNITL